MTTQTTFCVSHETPLVPPHLFDHEIAIGNYRPAKGTHISALDIFWDRMRPLAYGAAGNYVIRLAIENTQSASELTGIISHRKLIVHTLIGSAAPNYPIYREVGPDLAAQLAPEEMRPRSSNQFLICQPVELRDTVRGQYAHQHHECDFEDYFELAVKLGALSLNDVKNLSEATTLIPGGCELGVYPTAWVTRALRILETVGRQFVTVHGDRLRTYDNYQVRAVGFLAERLGSFFLLKELRRRYSTTMPRDLFGHLCVIVPRGQSYAAAVADSGLGPHASSTGLGGALSPSQFPPQQSDGPRRASHPLDQSSEAHDALKQIAVQLFNAQKWLASLRLFSRIAATVPNDAEIHNYRARALEALNCLEDALECVNLALKINPTNRADLRNRAIILVKLLRLVEAEASYADAIKLSPDDPDLLVRRALVLNQLDRREEALQSVSRAADLRPKDPDILNSRVIILDNLGRYTDALTDLDRMLTIKPGHIDAINNCGMVLARMGRFNDALTCYERSLAIKPDQPQALYNKSLIRLSLGDWIRGFQEFESRWNTSPLDKARISGLGTLWLGGDEDLTRKTILLYHEQGYGDTLQCVRYAPLVAERGARVILAVPPALAPLMHSIAGISQVVQGVQELPVHDYQAPLMSLPLAFRTTPDTVPSTAPYLFADPVKVQMWRERLGPQTKLRVGLAWGGRQYVPINYPRDIPLTALRPILSLDAEFISLQQEMTDADREILGRHRQARHFSGYLTDFAETAALVECLDLVISVDSAVAHLAGALGKPIWLMNRFASCWRWMQVGTESPWYPTLRQFRQTCLGDWTAVVANVRDAAIRLIDEHGNTSLLRDPRRPSMFTSNSRSKSSVKIAVRPKFRFVSATRLSRQEFFATSPLGRSLPAYRAFPKGQVIELRLFADNEEGLPSLYNTAIEEARSDPAILIFIHDDVYLSDYYWAQHLHQALEHFELVGLAGNKRRVPRQASWMYLNSEFMRDNYDNLSGVLGHGDPFPKLKQLSVYGEPGQEVKLLDGVMMAVHSETLIDRELRFDPRFQFHFYDLDFCRQAELKGVRMGTWAISLVHASAGTLGVDSWRAAYFDYLTKYGEL